MILKCGWCEKEISSVSDDKHKVTIKMSITTIEHLTNEVR